MVAHSKVPKLSDVVILDASFAAALGAAMPGRFSMMPRGRKKTAVRLIKKRTDARLDPLVLSLGVAVFSTVVFAEAVLVTQPSSYARSGDRIRRALPASAQQTRCADTVL